MRVEEQSYEGTCDDCGDWTTVFVIEVDHNYNSIKLCKKCLLKLLKAIVER